MKKKIIDKLELDSIRNVHEQFELDSFVNELEFEQQKLIDKIIEFHLTH